MLAIVLAAGAAAATVPAEVWQQCDPEVLKPLAYAEPAKTDELITELERRIAATLAEERREQRELDSAAGSLSGKTAIAVGAVGLLLVLVAAWIRVSRAARAVVALIGGGVCLAAGMLHAEAAGERFDRSTRLTELAQCHIRLLDARGMVRHSQLARTVYEFDEVGEDIMMWRARLEQGEAIKVEEIDKVQKTIERTLRPKQEPAK